MAHHAKATRQTHGHTSSSTAHQLIKGLHIARHNTAIHLIAQTLQANKFINYLFIFKSQISTCWNHQRQIPLLNGTRMHAPKVMQDLA